MTIALTGLGHVLFNVRDIERSRDFYTQVLGFEVLEEDPDHGGTFMSLNGGSHVIDLVQTAGDPSPDEPYDLEKLVARVSSSTGVVHVAFTVESHEALRQAYFELIDNGVPVVTAVDHENQESLYFVDPDQNMLELYYERPGSREMFLRGRKDVDKPIVFERELH